MGSRNEKEFPRTSPLTGSGVPQLQRVKGGGPSWLRHVIKRPCSHPANRLKLDAVGRAGGVFLTRWSSSAHRELTGKCKMSE